MKTQMKKLVIAIVMIVAFCGVVSAQTQIYAAGYQISFLGKNGWIVNDTATNYLIKQNFKNVDLIAAGGDTVYARVVDSTGTPVHVNYWINTTELIPNTIMSDTISSNVISFIVANSDTVTNGCFLQPFFQNGSLNRVSINRKFYIAPAILEDTVAGGKSVNEKLLKLSDFIIVPDGVEGGYTTSYDTIKWFKNDTTLVKSGLDTTCLVNVSGEYTVKIRFLLKTKQYVNSSLTIYGEQDHVYWSESNKLMINITSSSTVVFNVIGGNGILGATVDGVAITSNEIIADNKDVVFTATPATNYVVKQWVVNDTVVVGNKTNNFILNSLSNNVTVTVEFESVDGVNEEIKNDVIRIYPIPTTEFLNISKETNYIIYSIAGQEITRGFGNKINVSDFIKGVYILKTNDGNKKFVVE